MTINARDLDDDEIVSPIIYFCFKQCPWKHVIQSFIINYKFDK